MPFYTSVLIDAEAKNNKKEIIYKAGDVTKQSL